MPPITASGLSSSFSAAPDPLEIHVHTRRGWLLFDFVCTLVTLRYVCIRISPLGISNVSSVPPCCFFLAPSHLTRAGTPSTWPYDVVKVQVKCRLRTSCFMCPHDKRVEQAYISIFYLVFVAIRAHLV